VRRIDVLEKEVKKKSKKQRQKWWRNLSLADKEAFIAKKQAQKAKRRRNHLYTREVEGFEKTGVNPDNVEEWRKLIAAKNPWLSERQGNERDKI
jgi:hypothetical protein